MNVLSIAEKTRVPIQIQALEVLYDLLQSNPECRRMRPILSGDTIPVITLKAVIRTTTGGRCRRIHGCHSRRARTAPAFAFDPWILDKQQTIMLRLPHVQHDVTVLALETKFTLLPGRHLASTCCDQNIAVQEGVVYALPYLIWNRIGSIRVSMVSYGIREETTYSCKKTCSGIQPVKVQRSLHELLPGKS